MPIYEYSCAGCGKVFEELILRHTDEAELACPSCKGGQVSRLISRPAAPRTAGGSPSSGPAPSCGPVG